MLVVHYCLFETANATLASHVEAAVENSSREGGHVATMYMGLRLEIVNDPGRFHVTQTSHVVVAEQEERLKWMDSGTKLVQSVC